MKLIAISLSAMAVLSGCAHTSKGYREQAPRLELFSDKAPQTVLGCINEKWQRDGRATQYTPLPTGGTVSVDIGTILISFGNLLMLVDAETVERKTRVRFYRMSGLGANDYRDVELQIKTCTESGS
ncbi:hypothetical protein GCM10011529_30070 [Polymorphobacter glacialis]|uniref:Lipoprotein n=1 Tax=Sandarakinorhabdus glacialis TaxID=1614636 RepID=A0A917A142_9SPHN|nr:hypothetical protein [Polymorphobacter glacialis]GGE21431.1 hypothetical protein GCM10011529_30070 [Polymorphobacter glacialis]